MNLGIFLGDYRQCAREFEIAIITNDLVGKIVIIAFIGKIIIDLAGFSKINNLAGNMFNDLEGKRERL